MKEAMIHLVKDAFTTSLTIFKGLYAYLGKGILKIYPFLALLALAISLYTHNIHNFSASILGIVQSVYKISLPLALTSSACAGRVLR